MNSQSGYSIRSRMRTSWWIWVCYFPKLTSLSLSFECTGSDRKTTRMRTDDEEEDSILAAIQPNLSLCQYSRTSHPVVCVAPDTLRPILTFHLGMLEQPD